jgi:hypothetical protein
VTTVEWAQYLEQAESAADLSALRRATHTGRPLGTSEFVADLEKLYGSSAGAAKGGTAEESET